MVPSHVGKHAAACVMLSCFECSASVAAFCTMNPRTTGPPTTHARRHDYLHGHDGIRYCQVFCTQRKGAMNTMPILSRPAADLRVQWLRHCRDGGRAVLRDRQRPALWRPISDTSNRLQKSVQGEDAYPVAPAMMLRRLLRAISGGNREADGLTAAHRYTTSCFWVLVAWAQTRRRCERCRIHCMLLQLSATTSSTPYQTVNLLRTLMAMCVDPRAGLSCSSSSTICTSCGRSGPSSRPLSGSWCRPHCTRSGEARSTLASRAWCTTTHSMLQAMVTPGDSLASSTWYLPSCIRQARGQGLQYRLPAGLGPTSCRRSSRGWSRTAASTWRAPTASAPSRRQKTSWCREQRPRASWACAKPCGGRDWCGLWCELLLVPGAPRAAKLCACSTCHVACRLERPPRVRWQLVSALLGPCVENTKTNTTAVYLQGPEELFETTAQCLISGMDRDALSGWGAVIYVV